MSLTIRGGAMFHSEDFFVHREEYPDELVEPSASKSTSFYDTGTSLWLSFRLVLETT